MSLKKAVECIKRNNRFLITVHTSLEGDALGSELAFYNLLKKLGKQAVIINDDIIPAEYAFLPGVNRIKRFKGELKNLPFDCFVILDCSDLSRCGGVAHFSSAQKTLLNIDHHISNSRFADVNWVEPGYSSACEMVYRLFKEMRLGLDKETAMLLYVGILTDTGSFHYSNTKSATHKVAAELLSHNLSAAKIYRQAYANIPFRQMKILGSILSTLRSDASGRVLWLQLKNNFKAEEMAGFDLSEYLLSLMRSVKGMEVAALFKEGFRKRGEVRVNLRSEGSVDVNKIARFFCGGGHKTARGCTVKGSAEEAARRVLRKIKEDMK